MIDWDRLIQERNEWVARNFPTEDGETDHTIMGVTEELGELTHHYIKRAQRIRLEEGHDEMMKDAVGDMTVYLLGVMNRVGAPTGSPIGARSPSVDDLDRVILALGREVGDLAGQHLMYYRRYPAFLRSVAERIISLLTYFCELQGWDYDTIVNETWDHVMKRDWVAHREAAEKPA